MPSVYDLKSVFQSLLRPVTKRLFDSGITANQVTLSAVLLSLLGGIAIFFFTANIYILLVIPVVLFVRMALNAIDGMLAREYDQKSILGAVLNELGDIVSDIFLYGPLILTLPVNDFLHILFVGFIILAVISEFCGVLGQALVGVRYYHGPMGKSDRALVMGLYCIIFALNPSLMSDVNLLLVLFGLINLLLLVCCFNRLKAICLVSDSVSSSVSKKDVSNA